MTDPTRRPRWPGADLPGRRIFIAVPLPDEPVAAVAELVERVRAAGVPGGGRDVRWVRLDGLHLTLRFLGPTLEDRLAGCPRRRPRGGRDRQAVRPRRSAAPAPSRRVAARGRCGWASRIRPGSWKAWPARVDRALVAAGWPPETRPFRAHLTLARADGVAAGARIGARLAEAAADLRVAFRVDRIGLFESLTGGGPARYVPSSWSVWGRTRRPRDLPRGGADGTIVPVGGREWHPPAGVPPSL